MWPLLALSVLSVAIAIERAFFWIRTGPGGRSDVIESAAELIRAGDRGGLDRLLSRRSGLYPRIIRWIADAPPGDEVAVEAAERFRAVFERFSATLSTIITAAPLLGILGTVIGIIESFDLLGQSERIADVGDVASGIAEALLTTAFGLIVALVTLFPYMVFRAKADRCLGMIELLASARRNAASGNRQARE